MFHFQNSQTLTQVSKLPLVEAGEDFQEATTCLVGNKKEKKKEELMSEDIALSEENEEEYDEEELLRQAIALSLEM